MALPASDSFSPGAAGTLLQTYSANWVAGYSSGTSVLELTGAGGAVTNDNNDSANKWNADSFNNNHYAETILVLSSIGDDATKVGPGVRWSTAGNGYGAQAGPADIEVFEAVGGVFSALGSAITVSWASATKTVRLSANGSVLTIDYDGSQTTRSDSSHTSGSAGIVGWTASGTGRTQAIDWTADNLPAPAVSLNAVGTKSAGVTASPLAIAYPTVAARDMILAGAVAWNSTATVTTPASPWAAGGDLTGGTGTAADSHTGRMHVDQRLAVGTETGSVNFTLGGTISGAIGQMVAFRLGNTLNNWDLAYSTGTDDTHAANRSVTGGTAITFFTNDMVVAFVAVDTDTNMTITAPAFTATGVTFDTPARATSSAGVTSGNDGNIEIFTANITAGSATAQAPTFAFTTATSQCGPVVMVRLRAVTSALPLPRRRMPALIYR